MKSDIVYQDADILVINKPSGLIVHPKNESDTEKSVVSWLVENYPDVKNVGEDKSRPGIVHRLDKETSGLMIIAKSQETFEYLKKQFQEHNIKKTYVSLVHGHVVKNSGIIDTPLGKIGTRQTVSTSGKKELVRREAITEYKVVKHIDSYTLLEVMPRTGRTHQIRVHLASIGHGVVCDPWYGGKKKICPPELGRLFLHASKLEFTSPSGQAMTLEVHMPDILQQFLDALAK